MDSLKLGTFLPILISFALSALLTPALIPMLTRLKCGQYIREEGPEAHKKKAGTPTMGGLAFIAAMAIAMGIFAWISGGLSHENWAVLLCTVAFGLIGFIDDFMKIVLKHNEGLKKLPKFVLQILFAAGFALYLYLTGFPTSVTFRFFGEYKLELGWFFYVFVVFFMVAFNNGTNFTDGLDGLATSVTSVVAIFFLVICLVCGYSHLSVSVCALLGALLGFLLFNSHPAKIFMGDTGSLALGGFVCSVALLTDTPMLLVLVGFVYVAEVCSVILQVAYFKATKGKRLFKMAPIHHHFELCGWHETKVVYVFTLITAALALIALLIY